MASSTRTAHPPRPTAQASALGSVRRAARRAPPDPRRAWCCSTATGAAEAGEIDLVLRDGRTLVICEVKTRSSNDYGTPHEAVDRGKVDRLRRLAAALAARSTRPTPTTSGSTWSACSGRAAATRSRSTTSGGWLMSFATARLHRPAGAEGHLIDVQVDVSPGHGRHLRWSAGRTRRCRRRATGCGWRSTTQSRRWPATRRVTILLAPADLPKSGTHFDLAIAVAVKAADQAPPRDGARPPIKQLRSRARPSSAS